MAKKDQLLEKLREDAQQMANSLEDKVRQDLLSQKEALQNQHTNEMEALESKHLKERTDLMQELQCQFDMRLKQEVEQLQTVYKGERATDAEQVRSLQEALTKEKRVAAGLQDQVAEKDSVLSEYQRVVNDLKSQLVGRDASLHQALQKEYKNEYAQLEQAHAEEMQQHKQVSQNLSQQLQRQQGDHDKTVQQLKADCERITTEYQSMLNAKEAAYNSKVTEYEGKTSKLAHEHLLLQAQLVKAQTSRAAAEEALTASEKKMAESYATALSSVVVDTAIGGPQTVATADFDGKLANIEAKYKKHVAELETQLADRNKAMALLQKESQQQADAALAKLHQSLDAAHLEEVKKVKEELGLQKEMAVEDMAKQCRAASDEYSQFKAAHDQECLALQEQLQVLQEAVKTVDAVKIERDEALSQLRELSQGRDAEFLEIKQTSELQHSAVQAQGVREVEQLRHQLDHAQVRLHSFPCIHTRNCRHAPDMVGTSV